MTKSTTDIFMVLKNADFTEGRGPMFTDILCDSFATAETYVMGKEGIFGLRQERSEHISKDGQWHYNGYEIQRMPIHTAKSLFDKAARAVKIKELTAQIENLRAEE